jgi:hypothetical protein
MLREKLREKPSDCLQDAHPVKQNVLLLLASMI